MPRPSTSRSTLRFSVDARAILQLGRQSIRDHATAVLELVKNSYDADATEVLVEISNARGLLRVVDDGVGMSTDDFKGRWLRIGFSHKRRTRVSPRTRRTVVGEKGVGRISSDRLGARLALRSTTATSSFGADMDWDRFDVDGKNLEDIPVSFRDGDAPNFAGLSISPPSGTELRITKLRQPWSVEDVERLRAELGRLLSPWHAKNDFRIRLTTDIPETESGPIAPPWPAEAEIELNASIRRGTVRIEIIDRTGPKPVTHRKQLSWIDVAQLANRRSTPRTPLTGPFDLQLLYLPRQQLKAIRGQLPLRTIQERVLGIRVFRDGIRIRPYGDITHPEGDWLGLASRKAREPAGVARATYKMPPTEIAGAVQLSRRRNPSLVDSAGREGLIEDDPYRTLQAIALGCLGELEAARHRSEMSRRATETPTGIDRAFEQYSESVKTASASLNALRTVALSLGPDTRADVSRAVDTSLESFKQAAEVVSLLQGEHRLYRGLASIGIATSVFGHETETALSKCAGGIREAIAALDESPPSLPTARRFLRLAESNSERVAAWGRFAVARVRVDRRRRVTVRVEQVVRAIAADFAPLFAGAQIGFDYSDLTNCSLRAFPMDIEAILINFLTNAFAFATQTVRKARIRVIVQAREMDGLPGVEMIVADSGPGVPALDRQRIWEPLVSTRRDGLGRDVGTGLGLAIVDSIVREYSGVRDVGVDPQFRGARFSVWLPT